YRGIFLQMEALVESFRLAEAYALVEMPGNRRHGSQLRATIETPKGGLDIGVSEIDERHDVRMIESADGVSHFGRCLTILSRLRREDIFQRDANTIGSCKFSQLKKGFPFALISTCTVENLISAQIAAMLDEDTRIDPVTKFHECLGRIKLIAARGGVHEVGRDKSMDCVAELELAGHGHQTLGTILDDTAARNEIDRCQSEFNRIDP